MYFAHLVQKQVVVAEGSECLITDSGTWVKSLIRPGFLSNVGEIKNSAALYIVSTALAK